MENNTHFPCFVFMVLKVKIVTKSFVTHSPLPFVTRNSLRFVLSIREVDGSQMT